MLWRGLPTSPDRSVLWRGLPSPDRVTRPTEGLPASHRPGRLGGATRRPRPLVLRRGLVLEPPATRRCSSGDRGDRATTWSVGRLAIQYEEFITNGHR